MGTRIPQETIDEIRRRLEIVEVIADYLPLRRAGRNYRGLCPFHAEKTPSFMVSPERQAYHCFGCGAGGNVISFVMEHERVGFAEAIESLARRAGVRLPERIRTDPGERRENDEIFRALRVAEEFFRGALREAGSGQTTRDYLARRGITAETADAFGLGFAPAAWEALLGEARRQGIPPEALVRAGLARPRDTGQGHYDYFRNRLMFPIANLAGRVVGFGGRALDEQEPKYLNSPETPVFRKGGNLYGLRETRDEIRKQRLAVVVEGYMDFLSLYQAGARNMVAPLGTAFALEQARLMARYAPVVVLAYDGDEAGLRAVWQAAPALWEVGLRARVAFLPPGEDPDSFVRQNGLSAWGDLVLGAPDFTVFALADGQSAEEREEALRRLVSALARIRDEIRRSMYVKAVAERAGIEEGALLRAVGKEFPRSQGEIGPEGREAGGRAVSSLAQTREAPSAGDSRIDDQIEQALLRLLLRYPELQRECLPHMTPELFRRAEHRMILARLEAAHRVGGELTAEELLGDVEEPAVVAAAAALVVPAENEAWLEEEGGALRRRAAGDLLRRLRTRQASQSLQEAGHRLREDQSRGDWKEAKERLRQIQDLARQRLDTSGRNQEDPDVPGGGETPTERSRRERPEQTAGLAGLDEES